ncbi:transposase domain-containing protein [Mesorhizobium sp. M1403]|uniref:transposase domain-containing protein n=1 Tax=Mesorhizobium sp. M1403 TaxID=2957097 RepID=UPI00333D2AB4
MGKATDRWSQWVPKRLLGHCRQSQHSTTFDNWALLASIVATCRLNDVNPVAYLAETLDGIINGHPQTQIEELMPWRFRKTSSPNP